LKSERVYFAALGVGGVEFMLQQEGNCTKAETSSGESWREILEQKSWKKLEEVAISWKKLEEVGQSLGWKIAQNLAMSNMRIISAHSLRRSSAFCSSGGHLSLFLEREQPWLVSVGLGQHLQLRVRAP